MMPLHALGTEITRRRFVQGMAAAGVLAAAPWPLHRALAGLARRS